VYYKSLQHTATKLQHTATHCNTLQHTSRNWEISICCCCLFKYTCTHKNRVVARLHENDDKFFCGLYDISPILEYVLQCVAVCCSVLRWVTLKLCCSVLQCVVVRMTWQTLLQPLLYFPYPRICVAVCCSVLQCVAASCSMLQYVTMCCSVLQCVAVREKLQTLLRPLWYLPNLRICVAVCYSVLQRVLQRVAVCCSML